MLAAFTVKRRSLELLGNTDGHSLGLHFSLKKDFYALYGTSPHSCIFGRLEKFIWLHPAGSVGFNWIAAFNSLYRTQTLLVPLLLWEHLVIEAIFFLFFVLSMAPSFLMSSFREGSVSCLFVFT